MALENLAIMTDAVSRRASSWDRTGGNVDCLTDLPPGQTAVLMDVKGPGKVTHIWMTIAGYAGHHTLMRDAVVRIYWEDSPVPSVEVPIGDFFGLGHGLEPKFYENRHFTICSIPVAVGLNERAMNCYWPMPFQKAARIEVHNNGDRTLRQLYYHIDHELGYQPSVVFLTLLYT